MGCNSGQGDAQQAKGVLVTQWWNRHHTGTKTLSCPGFSSVHVCGRRLCYLNPLQLSQREQGPWLSAKCPLISGEETELRPSRRCLGEHAWIWKEERADFSFLFGKGFSKWIWKQLPIFCELWDVQMTYLTKFEMFHYLQLHIVLAFCPGRLKRVELFFFCIRGHTWFSWK